MSCHILFDHFQFTLIHGPDIPGSYAVFFFIIFRLYFHHQTHSQLSFPLRPSSFIFSGTISNHSLLFPNSTQDIFWPGRSSDVISFLPFHTVHGILEARILEWFAISFSSRPCFVRTLPYDASSWVALQSTAHRFSVLCKPLHHNFVIHEGDHKLVTLQTLHVPIRTYTGAREH